MSLEYVSVDDVRDWMGIKHTEMDTKLIFAIEACSNMVKNYLKDFSGYEAQRNDDDDYVLDSNYEPEIQLDANDERVVKAEVKLAVCELIRVFIDEPMTFATLQTQSKLPVQVEAILFPLRDPALA